MFNELMITRGGHFVNLGYTVYAGRVVLQGGDE